MSVRLALYQPDIPQNAGAAMRLCACLGVGLDVIEPCGFIWDDKKIRRAGMDYIDAADIARHSSWQAFLDNRQGSGRLVLLTVQGATAYSNFAFAPGDIIIAGRESAGVPDEVHNAADARLLVPMQKGMRSLNVVNASAMVLGEALRQTKGFAK
ncbi:MAG TPA: tRNA (cytidine(34)-2'-O)-methyltransferase [Patescibacteria group bacterium]|nr:tRNA (cytidine(34)-2'-O)-methyltransferase [Patescibacteria group bacterium]